LTDAISDIETPDDAEGVLRARVDRLEHESEEHRQRSELRVIRAEMKVEAMRAGMIDLDGLQFLDMTQIHLDDDGSAKDGPELISQLKRAKPWLFAVPTSSSVANVPPSKPARQKLATQMTDDEYRIARANIIRRSAL
jgi:hypothetical protein